MKELLSDPDFKKIIETLPSLRKCKKTDIYQLRLAHFKSEISVTKFQEFFKNLEKIGYGFVKGRHFIWNSNKTATTLDIRGEKIISIIEYRINNLTRQLKVLEDTEIQTSYIKEDSLSRLDELNTLLDYIKNSL